MYINVLLIFIFLIIVVFLIAFLAFLAESDLEEVVFKLGGFFLKLRRNTNKHSSEDVTLHRQKPKTKKENDSY